MKLLPWGKAGQQRGGTASENCGNPDTLGRDRATGFSATYETGSRTAERLLGGKGAT